uniref:Uncharacterized protein n=1 Tax=Solanum lycopersicum TaxID=4081 RepID=A0A3Q7JUF4_SOLLC
MLSPVSSSLHRVDSVQRFLLASKFSCVCFICIYVLLFLTICLCLVLFCLVWNN